MGKREEEEGAVDKREECEEAQRRDGVNGGERKNCKGSNASE